MLSFAAFAMVSCNEVKSETTDNEDMSELAEQEVVSTDEDMEDEQMSNTIVDVAVGNESFSTLVAAVKAAGLVETLSSEGPFTVFAPTNDAFAKLPAGTVDTLLKPENKEKLSSVLTYHVVSGKFDAATVVKAINDNNGMYKVDTVNGGSITLSLNGQDVILTDANGGKSKVVMADVAADNGIIHAIDTVVMPKG